MHNDNDSTDLPGQPAAGGLPTTKPNRLTLIMEICDPSLRVDVGFVQGGMTNAAAGKLVSLGSVSHQPLLVFYRGAPVELLSGLAGKRIAVGPVASGLKLRNPEGLFENLVWSSAFRRCGAETA